MTRAAKAFEETLARLGIEADEDDAEQLGRRAALLASAELLWQRDLGPSMVTKDLSEIMHCSRQAISERVLNRRLLALPTGGGNYEFPAFQFGSDGQPLPGLAQLLEILLPVVETPYTVAEWMVSPESELAGRRPIRDLREGKSEPVLAAARHYAERLRV